MAEGRKDGRLGGRKEGRKETHFSFLINVGKRMLSRPMNINDIR